MSFFRTKNKTKPKLSKKKNANRTFCLLEYSWTAYRLCCTTASNRFWRRRPRFRTVSSASFCVSRDLDFETTGTCTRYFAPAIMMTFNFFGVSVAWIVFLNYFCNNFLRCAQLYTIQKQACLFDRFFWAFFIPFRSPVGFRRLSVAIARFIRSFVALLEIFGFFRFFALDPFFIVMVGAGLVGLVFVMFRVFSRLFRTIWRASTLAIIRIPLFSSFSQPNSFSAIRISSSFRFFHS